jgi:SEC-C motif
MTLLNTIKNLFSRSTPPADLHLGRNDQCWCGSGKKYKYCHWHSDERKAMGTRSASIPSNFDMF